MLVNHVARDREKVGLRTADCVVAVHPQKTQKDFLSEIRNVRGITKSMQQEATKPPAVLARDAGHESITVRVGQAPTLYWCPDSRACAAAKWIRIGSSAPISPGRRASGPSSEPPPDPRRRNRRWGWPRTAAERRAGTSRLRDDSACAGRGIPPRHAPLAGGAGPWSQARFSRLPHPRAPADSRIPRAADYRLGNAIVSGLPE